MLPPARIKDLAEEIAQCASVNQLTDAELVVYLEGILKEIVTESDKTPAGPTSEKLDVAVGRVNAWLLALYRRADVRTVTFHDGTVGLIDVPNKYVDVINAMHQAMVMLIHDEPLPAFTAKPAKQPKRKR